MSHSDSVMCSKGKLINVSKTYVTGKNCGILLLGKIEYLFVIFPSESAVSYIRYFIACSLQYPLG